MTGVFSLVTSKIKIISFKIGQKHIDQSISSKQNKQAPDFANKLLTFRDLIKMQPSFLDLTTHIPVSYIVFCLPRARKILHA